MMLENIKEYWSNLRAKPLQLAFLGAGLGLLVSLGVIFYSETRKNSPNVKQDQTYLLASSASEEVEPKVADSSETSTKQMEIQVDIKGAVQKPGLYRLAADGRVNDLLVLAGGLTADADETSINRAQKLQDAAMIYVARKGEDRSLLDQGESRTTNNGGTQESYGKISINQADQSQLESLPGVGAKRAADIIRYREEHGPFKNLKDLTKISGIGEKTLEKWKELIQLD